MGWAWPSQPGQPQPGLVGLTGDPTDHTLSFFSGVDLAQPFGRGLVQACMVAGLQWLLESFLVLLELFLIFIF